MAASETPDDGTDSSQNRRDARRARSHRRRRKVIAIVGTTLVVAAGAVIATDSVRLGGDDKPTLAQAVRTPRPTTAPSSTSTTLPGLPCRNGLTNTEPLKVWVGGDSLAGALGPAFGTIAGATGVVQPYFHSRVASGLANPGFVDWPTLATKEMASVSPEIVVYIISTNDYGVPMNKTVDSTTGEVAWKAMYTREIEEMMAILGGGGRTVLWLGAPILKDTTMNDGVKELNAVEDAVVEKHTNADYFDTYELFADREGKYTANVTDADGKVIVARSGDGVHFTPEGATYLADAVFKEIDKHCKITAQAVTGKTLFTIQTPGSTQVAPGSGSSGGNVASTPPASTAAPTTSPPAATTAPTTASNPPPTDTTTAG